jgi:hypothetical protein
MGNTIQKNTINETPIGIVADTSVNTVTLSGSGKNNFYNVGEKVAPVPTSIAASASGGPTASPAP